MRMAPLNRTQRPASLREFAKYIHWMIQCEPDQSGKGAAALLRELVEKARYEYEDDGVGFPEDFDISNDGNLGMRFIRSLIKQIYGTPVWISDPLGVRFELLFRHELTM